MHKAAIPHAAAPQPTTRAAAASLEAPVERVSRRRACKRAPSILVDLSVCFIFDPEHSGVRHDRI